MAKGNLLINAINNKYSNQLPVTIPFRVAGTVGNVTSSPTTTEHVVDSAGNVTLIGLSEGTGGVDNTNPLSLSLQVTNLRTGNTLCSTVPKIDKTAGTGFLTTIGYNANTVPTGITLPVLQNVAVLPGDILKVVWTLTRTASPGTEIADASGLIVINPQQDFDPILGA